MTSVSLNSLCYKSEAFLNRFTAPNGEQPINARFANLLEMEKLAKPDFSGDSLLMGETRYKHVFRSGQLKKGQTSVTCWIVVQPGEEKPFS